MTNNSSGSRQFQVAETTEAMMRAYDSMPRLLRDVYKYTTADYALVSRAKEVDSALKSRIISINEAAHTIYKSLIRHEAEECYRTFGPDHPQSDNHGRRLRPNQIAIWGQS